jgi:hypothetical protein
VTELEKLGSEAQIDHRKIDKKDREEIPRNIDILLQEIDREPKTFGWKMREKIGTKRKWYNPVERPETVGGFGIWETLRKK